MFRIDDDLQEFLESGVAVHVGTATPDGRPRVTYAWGPRVQGDRETIDVFLDTARCDGAIADLRATGRIAMTVGHPVSYRSVQLKGVFEGISEVDDADRAWVQRHREAFLVTTMLVGDPPDVIRNLWFEEVTRITFRADRAFDQTPGPDAGRPL
ncbi:MAG: pyridoxamine 5'-phosphate oxidase family protein [Dehalococcoidia bacterium]